MGKLNIAGIIRNIRDDIRIHLIEDEYLKLQKGSHVLINVPEGNAVNPMQEEISGYSSQQTSGYSTPRSLDFNQDVKSSQEPMYCGTITAEIAPEVPEDDPDGPPERIFRVNFKHHDKGNRMEEIECLRRDVQLLIPRDTQVEIRDDDEVDEFAATGTILGYEPTKYAYRVKITHLHVEVEDDDVAVRIGDEILVSRRNLRIMFHPGDFVWVIDNTMADKIAAQQTIRKLFQSEQVEKKIQSLDPLTQAWRPAIIQSHETAGMYSVKIITNAVRDSSIIHQKERDTYSNANTQHHVELQKVSPIDIQSALPNFLYHEFISRANTLHNINANILHGLLLRYGFRLGDDGPTTDETNLPSVMDLKFLLKRVFGRMKDLSVIDLATLFWMVTPQIPFPSDDTTTSTTGKDTSRKDTSRQDTARQDISRRSSQYSSVSTMNSTIESENPLTNPEEDKYAIYIDPYTFNTSSKATADNQDDLFHLSEIKRSYMKLMDGSDTTISLQDTDLDLLSAGLNDTLKTVIQLCQPLNKRLLNNTDTISTQSIHVGCIPFIFNAIGLWYPHSFESVPTLMETMGLNEAAAWLRSYSKNPTDINSANANGISVRINSIKDLMEEIIIQQDTTRLLHPLTCTRLEWILDTITNQYNQATTNDIQTEFNVQFRNEFVSFLRREDNEKTSSRANTTTNFSSQTLHRLLVGDSTNSLQLYTSMMYLFDPNLPCTISESDPTDTNILSKILSHPFLQLSRNDIQEISTSLASGISTRSNDSIHTKSTVSILHKLVQLIKSSVWNKSINAKYPESIHRCCIAFAYSPLLHAPFVATTLTDTNTEMNTEMNIENPTNDSSVSKSRQIGPAIWSVLNMVSGNMFSPSLIGQVASHPSLSIQDRLNASFAMDPMFTLLSDQFMGPDSRADICHLGDGYNGINGRMFGTGIDGSGLALRIRNYMLQSNFQTNSQFNRYHWTHRLSKTILSSLQQQQQQNENGFIFSHAPIVPIQPLYDSILGARQNEDGRQYENEYTTSMSQAQNKTMIEEEEGVSIQTLWIDFLHISNVVGLPRWMSSCITARQIRTCIVDSGYGSGVTLPSTTTQDSNPSTIQDPKASTTHDPNTSTMIHDDSIRAVSNGIASLAAADPIQPTEPSEQTSETHTNLHEKWYLSPKAVTKAMSSASIWEHCISDDTTRINIQTLMESPESSHIFAGASFCLRTSAFTSELNANILETHQKHKTKQSLLIEATYTIDIAAFVNCLHQYIGQLENIQIRQVYSEIIDELETLFGSDDFAEYSMGEIEISLAHGTISIHALLDMINASSTKTSSHTKNPIEIPLNSKFNSLDGKILSILGQIQSQTQQSQSSRSSQTATNQDEGEETEGKPRRTRISRLLRRATRTTQNETKSQQTQKQVSTTVAPCISLNVQSNSTISEEFATSSAFLPAETPILCPIHLVDLIAAFRIVQGIQIQTHTNSVSTMNRVDMGVEKRTQSKLSIQTQTTNNMVDTQLDTTVSLFLYLAKYPSILHAMATKWQEILTQRHETSKGTPAVRGNGIAFRQRNKTQQTTDQTIFTDFCTLVCETWHLFGQLTFSNTCIVRNAKNRISVVNSNRNRADLYNVGVTLGHCISTVSEAYTIDQLQSEDLKLDQTFMKTGGIPFSMEQIQPTCISSLIC